MLYAALAAHQRLATTRPDDAGMLIGLSSAYDAVATALCADRAFAECLEVLREGQSAKERLVRSQPGNHVWEVVLAYGYRRIGNAEAALGEREKARASLLKGRDMLVRLQRLEPTLKEYIDWIDGDLDKLGKN